MNDKVASRKDIIQLLRRQVQCKFSYTYTHLVCTFVCTCGGVSKAGRINRRFVISSAHSYK